MWRYGGRYVEIWGEVALTAEAGKVFRTAVTWALGMARSDVPARTTGSSMGGDMCVLRQRRRGVMCLRQGVGDAVSGAVCTPSYKGCYKGCSSPQLHTAAPADFSSGGRKIAAGDLHLQASVPVSAIALISPEKALPPTATAEAENCQ